MSIYEDAVTSMDNIVAKLEAALNPKNVAVLFGYSGQAQEWPMVGGSLKPTAMVDMPNLSHWRGATGIDGFKNSMQELRFNVLNVGPSSRSAMQVMGMVCDQLVGYSPVTTGGEIRLIGSALGNPTPQTVTPTRYAIPIGFFFPIGASVVT